MKNAIVAVSKDGYIEVIISEGISVIYVKHSRKVKLLKDSKTVNEFAVDASYTVDEFYDYVARTQKSLMI